MVMRRELSVSPAAASILRRRYDVTAMRTRVIRQEVVVNPQVVFVENDAVVLHLDVRQILNDLPDHQHGRGVIPRNPRHDAEHCLIRILLHDSPPYFSLYNYYAIFTKKGGSPLLPVVSLFRFALSTIETLHARARNQPRRA